MTPLPQSRRSPMVSLASNLPKSGTSIDVPNCKFVLKIFLSFVLEIHSSFYDNEPRHVQINFTDLQMIANLFKPRATLKPLRRSGSRPTQEDIWKTMYCPKTIMQSRIFGTQITISTFES